MPVMPYGRWWVISVFAGSLAILLAVLSALWGGVYYTPESSICFGSIGALFLAIGFWGGKLSNDITPEERGPLEPR